MSVTITADPIATEAEIAAVSSGRTEAGAMVSFTGMVRNDPECLLDSLEIEHYPGMTTTAIEDIEKTAHERWPLIDSRIVHRYGILRPGETIVIVVTLSAHRRASFEAAEFIMDYLKTRAPFWKKEHTATGSNWVASRTDDSRAEMRWSSPVAD